MRILFIATPGKLDFYLDDLVSLLNRDQITAELYPLSRLNQITWKNFWHRDWKKRHIHLEKLLRSEKPDTIVINSSQPRFDFAAIRSFYRGKIIVYDMEGPNFAGFADPRWISSVDAVVTVSDYLCKKLRAAGYANVFYLPHGVNLSRFALPSGTIEDERFFIGRPSPHRTEYFTRLAQNGYPVRLYGRKWHELPNAPDMLKTCFSPIKTNINGNQLLERIASGRLFINALQDHFVDLHTLVNMQVFFISACRRGIITEYVEEIADLFEPDKEILIYRSFEELLDKVRFCQQNPDFADQIGQAAYQRVVREHTLQQRSDQLRALITSL